VSTTAGTVTVTIAHGGAQRDVTLDMRDLLTAP
jgi:hypothetical protein